jgi:hypothetical protein
MIGSSRPRRSGPDVARRRLLAIALQSTEVIAAAAFFAVVTVFLLLFAGGLGVPGWTAPMAAAAGLVAVSALVITSLHDPDHAARIARRRLEDDMRVAEIAVPEIRALIQQLISHRAAMESQRYAARAHAGTVEGVTRAADRWLSGLARLAAVLSPLQDDWRDAAARRQSLVSRIADLRSRVDGAVNPDTRARLRETLASRLLELRTLDELEALFENAQLRLEHACATLRALSSRILMLEAHDSGEFAADTLTAEIEGEIREIDSVIKAMQRVHIRELH